MNRELKDESYGVELLNSIGRAYQAKASQHQASYLNREILNELMIGIKPIRSSWLVPWSQEYIQYRF
jgi:hypothetical protein